jgi:hypothetical protein
MIVPVTNNGLKDGKYTDSDSRVWNVARLILHSKDLPVFDIPVAAIYIGANVFDDRISNAKSLAEHVKRVQEADFSYPVLMDPHGFIMDGWHRVVKALVEGRETIKAVRFETMPCHEYKEDPPA